MGKKWVESAKEILKKENEPINYKKITKKIIPHLFDLDSKITNGNKDLREIDNSVLREIFNEKIREENIGVQELSEDFNKREIEDKDGKKEGKYWKINDGEKEYRIYPWKKNYRSKWKWRVYDKDMLKVEDFIGERPHETIGRDLRDNEIFVKVKDGYFRLKENINVTRTEQDKNKLQEYEKEISKTLLDLEFKDLTPTFGLYFPEDIKKKIKSSIIAALQAGKNIIFIGPPGTGKTKIARNVAEQMAEKIEDIDGFTFTTATSDWTTFDTIGGYHPQKEEATSLKFEPGLFLQCFKENKEDKDRINKWLIIDEINRADIDKAFGQLFSVLSEDTVELQFTDESGNNISIKYVSDDDLDECDNSTYCVTPEWRLLATMNTYDKASLYEMSYAFMRRFAFIDVSVPSDEIDRELIDEYIECWDGLTQENVKGDFKIKIALIWQSLNDNGRAIGPAIVEDILRFLTQGDNVDMVDALALYVLPQLEGLRNSKQKNIIQNLSNYIDKKEKLCQIANERFEVDIGESEE